MDASEAPFSFSDPTVPAIINLMNVLHGHAVLDLPPPTASDVGGIQVAVVPKGLDVVSLKSFQDEYAVNRPDRIRTAAKLDTVTSLNDYLNRFKTDTSAVFVDEAPEKPSVLAVIDYHGEGSNAEPSFCTHTASYQFPVSDTFKAWRDKAKLGPTMSQESFANFLQDRGYDIANPPFDWQALDPQALSVILGVRNLHDDAGYDFWHAASRQPLWRRHPPAAVLPLTWRPDFLGLGAPTMEAAWMVWRVDHDGPTEYRPLARPDGGLPLFTEKTT